MTLISEGGERRARTAPQHLKARVAPPSHLPEGCFLAASALSWSHRYCPCENRQFWHRLPGGTRPGAPREMRLVAGEILAELAHDQERQGFGGEERWPWGRGTPTVVCSEVTLPLSVAFIMIQFERIDTWMGEVYTNRRERAVVLQQGLW